MVNAQKSCICKCFMNINIFSHLNLEIALEIPASNKREGQADNSGRQGLNYVGPALARRCMRGHTENLVTKRCT